MAARSAQQGAKESEEMQVKHCSHGLPPKGRRELCLVGTVASQTPFHLMGQLALASVTAMPISEHQAEASLELEHGNSL